MDAVWWDGWVARLRAMVPDAVAILAAGSHARDEAGPHSDVDIRVLRPAGETTYHALFERASTGRLRHVSVEVTSLGEWAAEADEPADWALNLPSEQIERVVWATPEAAAHLGETPRRRQAAGALELEDFIEWAGKAKNAHAVGDSHGLRFAAQGQARLAPRLLLPLNAPPRACSARDALRVALALPVSPPGYVSDMQVCLGLDPTCPSDAEVAMASRRLALGILAMLRERAPDAVPEADLRAALLDGTLAEYLAQD